ncbi:hypothetical protein HanXRQr2_Chr11g0517451 [Helianthus annuus]|uniref:Uncharacterized protein n=1 Tax=Helianthus annuus TaxID=4232 RepID=A0A9K3HU11_HELAN|nr:hypothetical protein HanXRQr2_Chr11g0517451 [Helianthus annuus]
MEKLGGSDSLEKGDKEVEKFVFHKQSQTPTYIDFEFIPIMLSKQIEWTFSSLRYL